MECGASHPSRATTALLMIDLVNPLDFEGGADLLARALPAAHRIAALRRRAHAAGVPSVFVNDNFDCWHLGFRELAARLRCPGTTGRALLDVLEPDPERDHFVLKAEFSGFFQTSLDVLLRRLGARDLVLTGIATDICVLATAIDAAMRGYRLFVPRDCVAAESDEAQEAALAQMSKALGADLRPSDALDLPLGA
jgi:nicotinamidase-related amidase